jgi:hypothetical protein
MTLSPPADGSAEADGLTFYRAALGARSSDDSFSIAINYAKSTPALSSPQAQTAPTTSDVQPTETSTAPVAWSWLPIAMAGVAAVIGLLLMFRRPRPPKAS